MADKGASKPTRKSATKSASGAQNVPGAAGDPTTPVHPAEAAIDNAQDAVDALKAQAATGPMNLPDFGNDAPATGDPAALALLRDVNLKVKVELGRTMMYVEDVLRLNENSIIELDKLAGDPVDIYVNDRPVARGEVLVVNDNFCVRVSEIIRPIEDD
jgi:flagellar motor switch protein FliN/FliY